MRRTNVTILTAALAVAVLPTAMPASAQSFEAETARVEFARDGAKPAKKYRVHQVLDLSKSLDWVICPNFDSINVVKKGNFKYASEAFLLVAGNPMDGVGSLGTVTGTVRVADGFGIECIELVTDGTSDFAIVETTFTTKKTRNIVPNGAVGFWGTTAGAADLAITSDGARANAFVKAELSDEELARLRPSSD